MSCWEYILRVVENTVGFTEPLVDTVVENESEDAEKSSETDSIQV